MLSVRALSVIARGFEPRGRDKSKTTVIYNQHLIEMNLFSPRYSCAIAHFAFKRLTHSMNIFQRIYKVASSKMNCLAIKQIND
jgi:hypothetical protein